MDKKKPKSYKKPEKPISVVSEAAIEYHSPLAVNETVYLPDEVLIGAIKYTQIARENDRMIPNSEVYKSIATKLRWK